MGNYEEYLKKHICPICHVAILEPHPEEKFKYKYFKCCICGFTKEIIKNVRRETTTIIGGKKDPNS